MNEKKSHISAAPRFVEMPVMWKTLTSLPHYFANPSGFTHSNKTFYKRNKCGTFNRNFNCRYPGKIIVVGQMAQIFKENTVYSIKEVAHRLKRPIATIRDWVFYRRIPFHKLNGVVCFCGKNLNEWIDSKLVKKDESFPHGGYQSRVQKGRKQVRDDFSTFVDKLK